MTGDPELDPTDDTDAELASLFSAMKQDQAPPDLEDRLIRSLAATSVVAATAAAVKLGFWHKVTLALNAYQVVTSAIVGGLCGVLVCGVYVVVDGSAPNGGAVPSAASAQGTPAAHAPDTSHREAPAGSVANASPEAPSARPEAPLQAPSKPLSPPSGLAPSVPPADSAPISAPATPSLDVGAPSGNAPSAPTDKLLQELRLVRHIANLVDGGRCAEARTAIARYGTEHPGGQLSGEVAVLAGRCQGR